MLVCQENYVMPLLTSPARLYTPTWFEPWTSHPPDESFKVMGPVIFDLKRMDALLAYVEDGPPVYAPSWWFGDRRSFVKSTIQRIYGTVRGRAALCTPQAHLD
jgi:hypothetical protein